MAKVSVTVALLALLGVGAAGCSSEPSSNAGASQSSAPAEGAAVEPVDLTGEWKQTNSNDPESFQSATITGDTIEVYWNATDSKSLYWAGSVEQGDGDSFSWDSVNDTSKTESSLLASSDDTKTFTYENGELSYDVTAMGTTMTVRLAKQ